MSPVDAFLLASAVAYYFCLALPKPTMKNTSLVMEKLGMLYSGTLILLNLFWLNHWLLWLIMGCQWICYAGASYLGYTKWNVLWREDVSDEVQTVMFLWDLTIAVCFFIKF